MKRMVSVSVIAITVLVLTASLAIGGATIIKIAVVMPEGTRLTADIEDPASDQPVVSVVHAAAEEVEDADEGMPEIEESEGEAPAEDAGESEES